MVVLECDVRGTSTYSIIDFQANFFILFCSGAVLQTPLWPTVLLAEGIMETEGSEE